MRMDRHRKQASPATTSVREPEPIEQEGSRPASRCLDAASTVTHTSGSGIKRVPTYAVGRAQDRRAYVRVRLSLPLRVQRVAGQKDANAHTLRTKDISSSGVYFLSPRWIEPGTPIDLELLVVDRPFGHGSVRMRTLAHVVRADDAAKPGWHGLAVAFDDISFLRDESMPQRLRAG